MAIRRDKDLYDSRNLNPRLYASNVLENNYMIVSIKRTLEQRVFLPKKHTELPDKSKSIYY